MGQIQLLDEATIDKIAAGEVVERPASVVKELVENAMDAKASAITIEIKDGGKSFIRITDNGCGIEAEDVATAFLRHATSKIRDAADLLCIHSLGFRGEALSSIAAVAQVELITKTAKAVTGIRYMIAGGKETSIEHIGCPEGTTFIVRNLFYNVPARQNYLKTAQTEGAHIYDLVQQLALSHPEISFQFIMNGQNRFHSSGNGNVKDIIYQIYGKEAAGALLPLSIEDKELTLKVEGYIAKPIVSRGNRTFENYYINQRYVKSNVIYKAIEDAYKNFTMVHRFPFVCLNFSISPEQIDVNVHPSKMELRFRQERRLYDVIKNEVRKVLYQQDLIPELPIEQEKRVKVTVDKGKPLGAQPFETARKRQEQKLSYETAAVAFHTVGASMVKEETPYKAEHAVNTVSQSSTLSETETAKGKTKQSQPVQQETVKEESVKKLSEKEDNSNPQPTIVAPVMAEQPAVEAEKPTQLSFLNHAFLEKEARPDHHVIGQLFKTYWLIEYDHKLFIMDQHAAHEKVNYERFMKHYRDKKNHYIQQLSPPIVITMTPKEAAAYEEYKEYFADFGFEIESFGGNEYTISGVPIDLYGIAEQDAFIGLLDELVENIDGTNTTMIPDKIATMACKASVKGNQQLSFAEADKLIDELLTLDSPFTCPHGRPTVISMTQAELEKKFKRIQDK